jgi:hypothetical protein
MTADDPQVRRTLARLKWAYRAMRREDRLCLQGRKKFTDAASTNVRRTWQAYDWSAPSELRETAEAS